MRTFKQHINEAKDIKKYSGSDLKSGSEVIAFSKFLYMDDSYAGRTGGNLKGSDNRHLPDDEQLPTALYMTVTGPDKSGGFLYPKGSYYVGFGRVNADGEVVMAFAGTARLVTYELSDAKKYVKKFSNLSLVKKHMEKGNKGMGAWPATYDLTGDFKGQGKGSKITKISSFDEIGY
jgi:hypothetical protein